MRGSPAVVAEEVAGGAVLDERLTTDATATTPVITTARAHATIPWVPSRNSTTSLCAEGSQRSRSRPATYPPTPKLTRAARSRYNPETTVSAGEVSLQVGDEETMPSPSAAPNAISTREIAEATSAPAKTGVHWRKEVAVPTATISVRSEIVTFIVLSQGDVQRRPRNDKMKRMTTINPMR